MSTVAPSGRERNRARVLRSAALAAVSGLGLAALIAPEAHGALAGLGFGALPSTAAAPAIVIRDTAPLGTVNPNLFGTNDTVYLGSPTMNQATRSPYPSVVSAAQTMGLNFVRMSPLVNLSNCANNVDCTYHWWSSTPGTGRPLTSPNTLSPDEWMRNARLISSPSATVLLNVNIEAGTVAEAQDWVAYMNGTTSGPGSQTVLADGSTVGQWAAVRTANGFPTPYGVRYWEMGNEEHGLHPCTATQNSGGCVKFPPTDCATLAAIPLYGCLVADYATAMKLADPSIGIVINYDGSSDYTPVSAVAGNLVSAVDAHQYGALVDPYGTTFDTDGQSATYTVTDSGTSTVALWVNSMNAAHLDASLDGVTTSFSVPASGAAFPLTIPVQETGSSTYTHTLTLTACDARSVYKGVCTPAGRRPYLYLHHITVTLGTVPATVLNGAVSCFAGIRGLQSAGQTTLVDTRVATTSGATGGAGNPGTPWRLSADSDFPTAFAVGQASVFGGAPTGTVNKLTYWRAHLVASGFGHTPLILGEYGAMGGCEQEPQDLAADQSAAIWSALTTVGVLQDTSSAQPILAAGVFEFHGGTPPSCLAFSMLTTKLTNQNPCRGSDTAYLQPVGLAMSQFASLRGTRYPVTITGNATLKSYPSFNYGSVSVPGVSAVAAGNGATTTLVLVNACPPGSSSTLSQCAASSMPVTISFGSGKMITTGTATTVAAGPYDDNTDAAPNAVSRQPVAVVVAGSSAAMVLPPFSVTTVTLS